MRNLLFALVLFAVGQLGLTAQCDPGLEPVTFIVDMTCSGLPVGTVPAVTGPLFGWCDGCAPLADADGDNIWEATLCIPAGDFEYKYQADGWTYQENLIGAGACAPITDGANYANRLITVPVGGMTVNDTYGSCTPCNAPPVTVTFCVDMTCSGTAERPPAVTGPLWTWCDGCNPLADPDGDDIWCGDLVLDDGAAVEYKYQSNGWTVQENLIDDMQNGASCAPVTDFANYANRLITASAGLVINDTYGSCDACPAIPTVGEWGLLCLSISFLSFGLIFIRQRTFNLVTA